MKKDIIAIGSFLVFLFILSMAAHMLYVKGYAFKWKEAHSVRDEALTIYKTQSECEQISGTQCFLQLCDDIVVGGEYEDICSQGFTKVWQVKTSY